MGPLLSDGARSTMDSLFEHFRSQLEASGAVRDALKLVVADLDATSRLMQAGLLPIQHGSSLSTELVVQKVTSYLPVLRELYRKLAEIIQAHPGQYYRYHELWRNQTHSVVSILAFVHWLGTQTLLSHTEMQQMLFLTDGEFEVDLEDYLIGICNFSGELPRFVVNRVTAGDYECPRHVSDFLTSLYSAFRVLNLRNDTLRKRFDGMKYDLKKVEEVLYDVKIRGLKSGAA